VTYGRALAADSRNAAALAGRAACCLRRDELESSVDWALQALDEDMRQPAAHYRLGLALMRMDRFTEAAAALEMAAQLIPQLAGPHRWLAAIYEGTDGVRAAEHRRLGREIINRRRRARA
jgi:tetratricopeptide (TPR) repeat protein